MSIQDDMYDVEAEVKGTDAEEAFERFSKWAGAMESDWDKLYARYTVLVQAFNLIRDDEELKKEFDKIDNG